VNEGNIWWGQYNRPIGQKNSMSYLPDCRVSYKAAMFLFRIVMVEQTRISACRSNYHRVCLAQLIARNMFIKLKTNDEYRRHVPDFTVIAMPSFRSSPVIDQTPSETFIALNF